jgi:hypothetical protein
MIVSPWRWSPTGKLRMILSNKCLTAMFAWTKAFVINETSEQDIVLFDLPVFPIG